MLNTALSLNIGLKFLWMFCILSWLTFFPGRKVNGWIKRCVDLPSEKSVKLVFEGALVTYDSLQLDNITIANKQCEGMSLYYCIVPENWKFTVPLLIVLKIVRQYKRGLAHMTKWVNFLIAKCVHCLWYCCYCCVKLFTQQSFLRGDNSYILKSIDDL